MSAPPPVMLRWDGEAFSPANSYMARVCDQHFVVGERYLMTEHQERSSATHRHYFAAIKECWLNLPERIAGDFPTTEHLRKYALIKTGFYDSNSIVCSSKSEALRVAAFSRPVDEFAVVDAIGATVTRYVAKSQSTRAMGKDEFQRSKTAVLDFLEGLIGVERGASERAAA